MEPILELSVALSGFGRYVDCVRIQVNDRRIRDANSGFYAVWDISARRWRLAAVAYPSGKIALRWKHRHKVVGDRHSLALNPKWVGWFIGIKGINFILHRSDINNVVDAAIREPELGNVERLDINLPLDLERE